MSRARTAVKASLAGLLLLAAPTLEDCGGPPPSDYGDAEQQAQQQDDGCPPSVAWARPGAGTVTDVKTCPGLFGTEVRYILVDSGPRQVWLADPAGACQVGDDWGPTSC